MEFDRNSILSYFIFSIRHCLGRNIFPVHVSLSDGQLQTFQSDSPSEDRSNSERHEDGFTSISTNNHYAVVELDADEKIKIWAYSTCWWKMVSLF